MTDIGIAQLFLAVEAINKVKVTELIAKGISPNSFKDESHITPLHYCTQMGDVQMFKFLLENKASLRKRDRWMDSVVHYACRYGNMHILELILIENTRQQKKIKLKQVTFGAAFETKLKDRKVKHNLLNLKGKECKLPISEAIMNGHISCVVMLFDAGAAMDVRDINFKAPIDISFDLPSGIHNEMLEKLMAVDEKMKERPKFVIEICKYGGLHNDEKIEKKINKILANFSQSEKEKWLEIFLHHNCVVEVKKLLEEPNYYTWNILKTILKKAVECSHDEIVKLVVNEQTGITADEECIKLCIKNQNIEILKYLLKFHPKGHLSEEYEMKRIINVAIETLNVEVVKVLFNHFDNPIDYVTINKELWIELVENKCEELIKHLLNAGMELNDAKSPLMAAIKCKNEVILKCIIDAGAEPSNPEHFLQLAITSECIEIVKLALTLPGSNLKNHLITKNAFQTKNSIFLANLISLGLELHFPDIKHWSALTTAVETKELNVVELVYNSGCGFSNSKDEIWKAVEHSSTDILDCFFKSKCSTVKLCNNNGWNLLHEAVSQDKLEIVKLLMKNIQQSEINMSGRKSGYDKHETPLSLAVLRRNVEITKILIFAGADVKKRGLNLYKAVVSGSEENVSILLRAGISTCLNTAFGLTMLHVAVIKNNVNIVKQLLPLQFLNINAKVDLSDTNRYQFKQKYGNLYVGGISYINIMNETTAIQMAVRQNSEDIVQQLLNRNADITVANNRGCLPWVEALFNCNHVLMNILLQKYQSRDLEIDVNMLCEINYKTTKLCTRSTLYNNCYDKQVGKGTLIYLALSVGNLGVVRILLEHGASVSKTNNNGETALFGLTFLFDDMEKVYQGVQILIENGADINHLNADGNTVLNIAVRDGNIELMKVLILEGAEINWMKDETIKMLLKSQYISDIFFCHIQIIHFVLQHGYNFQHLSKLGELLLHMDFDGHGHDDKIMIRNNMSKAQHTICEILNHMKSLGFNIQNKVSQLLLTSAKYDLQVLGKYLLLEGCDVNVINKNTYAHHKRNALNVALENCNFHFMKILLDAGANWIDNSRHNRVLNTVLKKASDGFNTRQYSKRSFDTFSIEDSFICNERNEDNIASIITVFDTILNRDVDFEAVFALDDFRNSAIAFSIEKNIPWAVEYFLKHDSLKLILDSEHICAWFDLLLLNFHISTAKILIDEFGTELVQSNPNIWQNIFQNRQVTEEEKLNLTQWLFDKGLSINCQDDDRRKNLNRVPYEGSSVTDNCEVLELAIDEGYLKIANFLLPYTYPNGIKQSKAEHLILDYVIFCEHRHNDKHQKRTFIK